MYIVYDVLQEFSPSTVYGQSPDRPVRYLSKFEFSEGIVSKFWGPAPADELVAAWEGNFRIARQICVWGLKQIVAEMSNAPSPGPLPFRASDLDVTRIL
jgi:hypothetical protein